MSAQIRIAELPAERPAMPEASDALRQLDALLERLGPHDDRVSYHLTAAMHAVADAFGDDPET